MNKIFKAQPIFIILIAVFIAGFIFLVRGESVESIVVPEEKSSAVAILDQAILKSKTNIDLGIEELESIKNIPEYTDYKRKYILARLYETKKNNLEAIKIYESIYPKPYPLKERILFHIAVLKTSLGDDKSAIKYFEELLRKFPDSKSYPQAKYFLAQTQLRLRLTSSAIENLLSLKSKFPKTQYGIATNYYLGEYDYNNQNYESAVQCWREYLKLSPDGRFALEIVDLITSQKTVKLKPSDYSLIGDVFFYKKEYKKSAYYYSFDKNPRKYYQLGYSFFRIGEKDKASSFLKEYAYAFPKSKNAKWALYYSAKCIPSFMRKSFWSKVTKDIPELSFYTIYKEGLCEENDRKRESVFKNLLELYPQGEFSLDAVWELMWRNIKERRFLEAESIGKKYFDLNEKSINSNSEARLKVGFWLGKIAEMQKRNFDAIAYYKQVIDVDTDNYYYYRSKYRLLALTGGNDPLWQQQFNPSDYSGFSWTIPMISRLDNLKDHYGITVAELINLQQFDEAIELIGKNKAPSKQVTAWLKALNSEYDTSINLSSSIINRYLLPRSSPMWQLAYPLYYWEYISKYSSNYKTLDPLFVPALIRQESRYDKNAASISNAFGLMQFIIPTARVVSAQLGIPFTSPEILKEPSVNIALGASYINGLIVQMGNPLFAVASYNAGPGAVKGWIAKYGSAGKDLDFFIEQIPYDETRNYVKKVFANYWTYISLYRN